MDGEYTAVTFISILALRKLQNARGAVRFQREVGGYFSLVAVANATYKLKFAIKSPSAR